MKRQLCGPEALFGILRGKPRARREKHAWLTPGGQTMVQRTRGRTRRGHGAPTQQEKQRCTRRPGKLHMQSVFVDSYTRLGRKEQRTRRGKGSAHAHAQGPHTQSGRSEQPRCIRSFRRRSRTQGRWRRNQRGRSSTSMLRTCWRPGGPWTPIN